MPRDPLADAWNDLRARKPPAKQVAALRTVCAAGDGPELERLLVTFIDRVVATGHLADALAAAVAASRDATPYTLPKAPATRGDFKIKGPHELDLRIYALRDAIPPVLAALARRARARPALVAWLFEACKLYACERGAALECIDNADPGEAVFTAGCAELARHAAKVRDPGLEVLRDALEHWGDHPARCTLLLAAIAAHRRLDDALGRDLYGEELGPLGDPSPAWTTALRDPALRERLVTWATDAGTAVRRLALHALTRAGLESDVLHPLVVAALRAPAQVAGVAAEIAQHREFQGDELVSAARTARRKARDPDLRDALDALIAAHHARATPLLARPCGPGLLVECPDLLSDVAWLSGQAIAAYRRVLVQASGGAWRTDRDEFGVVVVRPDGGVTRHPLPVAFPVQRTGASGARREIHIPTAVAGRIVLVISSPFSDEEGWGNRNYLLAFDPQGGTWWQYRGRKSLTLEPLAAADEHDLPRASYAEAIVYAAHADTLAVDVDDTPYHLDDVDPGEHVHAARRRQRKAAARLPWRPIDRVRSATHLILWQLRTAGAPPIVVDTTPIKTAWNIARNAPLRLDSGSAIPGRVALVLNTDRPHRQALLVTPYTRYL